ncbi:15-hydroxyprostaglandin dehydrogenase [NAD(+)]-like [Melanaphis sacchari]|uniref:15-hydroxyprostaglandin dehydrogenase [NAD(+)] n=1 Tax=Melanaphis sacchari TaxID=742174 RepID=A0A2H8TD22_9HEMI|nr:15-hydroxyprostaglandin dehydrogenase [NAD(+)]-like [Melanaphis sacchari]XP_025204901.1 15-hydroxyprostaglandin dehydrogenase [NAD(+)]-like [Melanaphis sacchari]
MLVLKNQVALITSATSTIGKAYAKHLLQNGVKVALCDIDFETCQSSANEFANVFGDECVLALGYSVADQGKLESAFISCIHHFGRLDIVVNNTAEMWFDDQDEISTHYGGVVNGTLLAIKYMGAPYGGKGGTMVQTTNSRLATSAVVEYTKAIGAVPSSMHLNIRTMALNPRSVSDNVGKALIYILKQGITGQYWIVENEETPRLAVTADIIN